ncbi:hypothetical protein [Enterococcus italicus]|uniref:hypothetical protein n=1 Tax=Enterococcus italicus TaxID=246144 RepID=UPI0020745FC2|nr:hypothetical protein [Enterococcus italicus]
MTDRNSTYSNNKPQIIFHLFFSIAISSLFLRSSMFVYSVSSIFFNGAYFISIVGLITKVIIFDRFSIKELIAGACLLFTSFLASYMSEDYDIFFYALLIIACKNITFKNVIKNHFFVNSILLISVTFLALNGFLTDIIFQRDGILRHSLGLLYPTVYAARVFFLIASYIYLKKYKLTIINLLIVLGIGYFTFYMTNGRLDLLSLILLCTLVYVLQFVDNKRLKIVGFVGLFFPIISTIIAWITAYFYNAQSNTWYVINLLFSGRLGLGYIALNRYDIKIFGQKIYEQGLGGIEGLNNITNSYFFIDSSYLAILVKYGWAFLVVIMILIANTLIKFYKKKEYKFIIIYIIICINCLVATFFYSVPVNPFILGIFSNIYNDKES